MTQVLSAMSRKASYVNSDKVRLMLQYFMISQFNHRQLKYIYIIIEIEIGKKTSSKESCELDIKIATR